MKLILTSALVMLSGCTAGYVYDKPPVFHAGYISVLNNRQIEHARLTRTASTQQIQIGGINSTVDDAALRAIGAGIVEGAKRP